MHLIIVVKIRTKENITRNQCEFSVKISKLPGARENGSNKVAIGLSFKSDWLKKWREVSGARENSSDQVSIGFSFKSDRLKKWREVPEAREMLVT